MDLGPRQKPLQVKRECVAMQGSVFECRSRGYVSPRRSPPGVEYRCLLFLQKIVGGLGEDILPKE